MSDRIVKILLTTTSIESIRVKFHNENRDLESIKETLFDTQKVIKYNTRLRQWLNDRNPEGLTFDLEYDVIKSKRVVWTSKSRSTETIRYWYPQVVIILHVLESDLVRYRLQEGIEFGGHFCTSRTVITIRADGSMKMDENNQFAIRGFLNV